MTSDRLAEVRANLPDPSADLSRRERDSHALLAHVDHLTAENARLREGILRVLRETSDDFTAEDLATLLNPPTEGETDHE